MSIASKHHPIEIRQKHLSRIDLVAKLESCKQPLILLHATAGYGKSSLIADWLAKKNHIGWVNLDPLDNDPIRFLHALTNAINQATANHDICSVLSTQSPQPPSLITYVTALIDKLQALNHLPKQKVYLVLDGYQHINHPEIDHALKILIHSRLQPLTIVLLSRTLPNVGIANLRAKQQLLELTNKHLAFDAQEIQGFAQLNFEQPIAQDQLDMLQRYSEGWPSALQLLALQSNHQFNTFTQFSLPNSPFQPTYIWDYLAEEVYQQLTPDVQTFLLKTSIVDCFNLDLAQTITQEQNSAAMIEFITRHGIFITSLEHGWYRYHPLLLKFLTIQRHIEFGIDEASLHILGSVAWTQQQRPEKALFHALIAEDATRISQVIYDSGWHLFHLGELHLLDQALEKLSHLGQEYTPNIALLKAWILQIQFRYHDVEQQIEHCLMRLATEEIEISNNLRGEFNALLAQVAINQNEPELARERAEFSLVHLDHASYRARLIATSVLGEVCHVEGSLSQALSLMQQTEKYARQHQFNHQVLWALIQQIEIHTAMSHSQTAYELQSSALEYVKRHALEHLPLFDLILRLRAKLLCDWHRLNEAESLIKDRIAEEPEISEHSHLPAILARIALQKGNHQKARDLIGAHSLDLMPRDAHLDWQAELSHSLILLWLSENNQPALQQWLNRRVIPQKFSNHFSQQQGRNQVLALMGLANYSQAESQLKKIEIDASKYSLTCDQFRNRLLFCQIALKQQQNESAKKHLMTALESSLDTNYIGEFSLYGESLLALLEEINSAQKHRILIQHRLDLLIDQLAPHTKYNQTLNQEIIAQLNTLSSLPDVLKTSPLTNREWQVLTSIYAGLTNEQIAYQFDIAPTTLKTHIRNLYQKLNIPNRKAAQAFAAQLIALVYQ
jgi:LuxR family maltose regulon positive regulatory protein